MVGAAVGTLAARTPLQGGPGSEIWWWGLGWFEQVVKHFQIKLHTALLKFG